jgi:dTDP-4-dehydrorhamnose 3,5-epimerase
MKGIGREPAFFINCPTEVYVYDQPDEFRLDPHDPSIPYRWERKDG